MSDSTKKRSRKSKLVPREYIEIEDDSVPNLQTKSWKEPVKILPKASAAENTPSSTITGNAGCDDFEAMIDNVQQAQKGPQREFNITVAVEKFDENSSDLVIDEKPSLEDIDNGNTSSTECVNEVIKPTGIPQTEVRVFAYNSKPQDGSLSKVYTHTAKQLQSAGVESDLSKMYVLDRNKILDIANELINESNNPADVILGVEVKNCMGHFPIVTQDKFQYKIQRVLDQWQDWQKVLLPKYRSPPLFYKCYICQLSWWHLYNFTKHLKKHEQFQLDLEECTLYEANLVAYRTVQDIIHVKQFETEGNCPRCEKEFAVHKTANRLQDGNYKCSVAHCIKSFQTCTLLRNHETTCHTFSELNGTTLLAIQWKKTCEVCGIVCHTQIGYRNHMILLHSVRSDLVVAIPVKRCQLCHSKYAYTTAHLCASRGLAMQCHCCFRVFPHGLLYNTHKSRKGYIKCRICKERLPSQCMEAEHVMKHTDKFQIVHKCITCKNFTIFLDENAATHHEFTKHSKVQNYDPTSGISLRYLDKIIIPKECLKYGRSVVEGVPQIVIKEEEKSTTDPPAPELKIKQEIIDSFETITGDDEMNVEDRIIKEENDEENLVIEQENIVDEGLVVDEDPPITIKQEIPDDDNFDVENFTKQYSIKIEPQDTHSKIFGIKVEPETVKQEQEEEEYEDDIIRLDYNFENMAEAVEVNPEEVLNEAIEIDEDDSEDTSGTEKPNDKTRKLYRCNKCGLEAYHKAYKRHILTECETVERKSSYLCTKCNKSYKTFRKFVEHFHEHGLPSRSCPVCFKVYEGFTCLLAHVSMHIRTKYVSVRMITLEGQSAGFNFQCRVCKDYVDKPDFFQHWEKHLTVVNNGDNDVEEVTDVGEKMNDRRKLTLTIDDGVVKTLIGLLQSYEHMERLRPGCVICHKHFSRRNDYKRHLIEHLLSNAYSNKDKYSCLKCQICAKGFKKAEGYKKHMRDHGSLPVYKCEICDKTFSDSSNFTKHKKIHNVNAYTCDICGKRFQAKYSIIKHMAIHDTQKPLICEPCNKVFYLASAFRKHNRMLHDKVFQKFGCAICSEKFRSLKEKWDHLWHVHKERKYKADCLLCSKSYRRFLDLKHHLRNEHQTGLVQHTRMLKERDSTKTVYDLLKDTKIVGLRTAGETLVVYE